MQTVVEGDWHTDQAVPMPPSVIRHNMKFCVMLDTLWSLGWQDFAIAMTPLWVYLGASDTIIGISQGLPVIGLLGLFLSPWITRRFPVKKWYLLLANLPYHAPIGIIGLVVILAPSLGLLTPPYTTSFHGRMVDLSFSYPALSNWHLVWHQFGATLPWLTVFVLSMVVAHQFFTGFVALPHQEYVAACIPMSHRGRFSGISATLGNIAALISTGIAGWILYNISKPACLGYLLLMTFIICQGGYFLALFAKEKRTPVEQSPKPWSRDMFKAAWGDKAWLRIVFLFSALSMITGAAGYVGVYGMRETALGGLGLPVAISAVMAGINKVVGIPAHLIAGLMVDRLGAKRIVAWWSIGTAIAYLPVIFIHSQWGVYGFVLLNVPFVSIWVTADKVLLYGLPKAKDRAGHYTLQLMIQRLSMGVGGFATGVMLDRWDYHTMFIWTAVAALLCYPLTKWAVAKLSDDPTDYS